MLRTRQDSDLQQPHPAQSAAASRIGVIAAVSVAGGTIVAAVVIAAPFTPAQENVLVAVMLLGFAVVWALLAVLSVRFTDQPQRWAAAPAAFFAVTGLASLCASAAVQEALGWVWPPVLLGLCVWMIIRAPRQLRNRSGQYLLYAMTAALLVASGAGGYETVRESLDANAYPVPGHLVDVGGHRLHLHCTGSGSPTVVLEPGLGAAASDLGWITPTVARDTTVCVYDRAGRGWSDATDGPQDGATIAADLHTLLERADVPGPYVLAGHSFGGLYVLSFAAQFPDQVAGLVLLDSTAPKPGTAMPVITESSTVLDRLSALLPAVAHLGAGRLLAQSSYDSLPPQRRAEARANASTSHHLHSFIDEFLVGSASMQQASALTSLNGKPLLVLTASTGHDPNWQAAQDQLATLSANSLHRMADATHESLVDDEADSAAATQAIRDVVASVRSSEPLPRY